MIKSLKDSIASTDDLISYMDGRGRNLAETDPEVMRDYEKNKAKLKGLEFVEAYRKQTVKNRVTAPNSVLDGTNEMFTGSTSMQTAMSQGEIDAAYDEAIQAEYDYQMSLEPISRDPRYPGGERGLKELSEAVNAAERAIASIEAGALDPIPNGLDPEEYVSQLRLALPDKRVELYTDENGSKFVKISEIANKSGIFGASLGIFGMKDLEDTTGPSQSFKKPVKSNKDAVDQVMAQVSEAMDKGIIPWKKPWTGGGSYLPTSGATGKNYKGGNLIILQVLGQFRGYEGTRWYTKNAIAKLGGYVDDNDAVMITKVVKSKYTVKPDESKVIVDPKTGDQTPDDGSRTKTRLDIDFVYNEDVVKGITIPPLPRKEPPAIHEVEDIILESYTGGPNIIYSPGDSAFWSPDTDTISLPLREQFNSTEEHLDTLFHELTHSTGAADRLDRKDLLENYGTHKDVRAREELIAEIGSAILAAMFGVNTSIENVTAYVQSWKRFLESEPNALFEAASMASKAVDYILAGYYEDNPDEEYDPENRPTAESMPIEEITGEDSTFGGLGNGINYRIEGNRIFLMGSTMAAKDLIKSLSITPKGKSIPFSFFWDRKANNWSISLADAEDRVNILNQLRDLLGG
jgi:antirestriction protein ArdC